MIGVGETLAHRTAQTLVGMSLACDPGAYLGSEDELLVRLGVSRPTLRQAAKMVERDRMISVRRGTRGGYYAERPDARDAIQSLARFLRIKGASLADVIQVTRPVSEEAAAAAARRRSGEDIENLRALLARVDSHDTPRELIAVELEMARLISRIGGNPVVELVMEIGYSFGLDERGSDLYADRARRERARAMQRNLLGAIIEGDPDIARLMMRRRSRQFDAWLNPGEATDPGHGDC